MNTEKTNINYDPVRSFDLQHLSVMVMINLISSCQYKYINLALLSFLFQRCKLLRKKSIVKEPGLSTVLPRCPDQS